MTTTIRIDSSPENKSHSKSDQSSSLSNSHSNGTSSEFCAGVDSEPESPETIPQKIFFRIGEVANLLEVKPSVLRFWETEFPFIHPTKSASGHRVYRRKEVEKLFVIKRLLYVERFSIEGAKKKMKEMKQEEAKSREAEPTLSSAQLERLKRLAALPVGELFRF